MYHILLYPEASKGKQDFFFICAKTDFQLKVGSIKNRYFCTPRYWYVPPVSLRNKLVGTKKSVFCVEKFLIRNKPVSQRNPPRLNHLIFTAIKA